MPHPSRPQSGAPSILIVLLNCNAFAETTSSLASILSLGIWLLHNGATAAPDTLSSLVRLAGDTPDRVTVHHTAMLIRASLLRKIGLLNDHFFACWKVIDLSARSMKAGFRNAVDFNSSVLHSHTNYGTNPNHTKPHHWYFMARNETLFWRKRLGLSLAHLKVCLWGLKLNRISLQRLAPSPDARRALLAGIWDPWLGRTGPWHAARRAPTFVHHLLTSFPPRSSPTLVANS